MPKTVPAAARAAYSIQETADLLGVSRNHINRLAARGQIRIVPMGHRRLVTADELERILHCTLTRSRSRIRRPAIDTRRRPRGYPAVAGSTSLPPRATRPIGLLGPGLHSQRPRPRALPTPLHATQKIRDAQMLGPQLHPVPIRPRGLPHPLPV
jgi:excisionase family DNA binding protein